MKEAVLLATLWMVVPKVLGFWINSSLALEAILLVTTSDSTHGDSLGYHLRFYSWQFSWLPPQILLMAILLVTTSDSTHGDSLGYHL